MSVSSQDRKSAYAAVIVAALGYFVDVYDLILFSIVRVASLKSLGVPEENLLSVGVFLLNCQMAGMLAGGLLWGVMGDKKGRLSVLFGSIFLYSAANIANGFVESIPVYAVLRFVAGVGLAGELGAGITLVSEMMPKETRGYATTIVATVGVAGAIAASMVGDMFDWRTAYFVGGGMGIALLILRVMVHESGLFDALKRRETKRGDLILLLKNRKRFLRYLCCIFVGLPTWYAVGILMTFAPEIGKALDVSPAPSAGDSIFYCYLGLVAGDFGSGILSQFLRSRKKVLGLFIFLSAVTSLVILNAHGVTTSQFYIFSFLLGIAVGYWAVFVTTSAEQFGTNLRATVATTAPNFVRGSVVLVTSLFKSLTPSVGIIHSAMLAGALCVSLAFLSLLGMSESFSNDLDFLEE